ncbi:putative ATP-dependent helicase [Lachnellula suecica]|uniref:Putative ATP-dependent helicase n=1 Tax=Lachnellula suecica TaxID=602035 RepID=A0A8T9C2T9_9HELO|nr:putative ATP-dependent helicase [Lachnellula suecica]
MDDFDFDRFIDTENMNDAHDRSQQASDQAMGGMSPAPETQLPDAQHAHISATPDVKREDSEGLFIPDTPEPAGNGDEENLPELPQLGSPFNFETVPERNISMSHDNLGTQVENAIEDDDDMVMINPSEASPEAQARWSEPRDHPVVDAPESFKSEPKDGPPVKLPSQPINFAQMMAAQQAMLQGVQQKKAASMFGASKPPADQAEGSHRRRSSFVQLGDEHEEANAAMRGEVREDDDDWMNDENAGYDEEYDILKTSCRALERKNKNGKITESEQLELTNIKSRIKSKDKVKAAVARALAQSTFDHTTGDSDDEGLLRMLEEQNRGGDFDGPGNTKGAKGKQQRKKSTGKRPQNAREYHNQTEAKREKERAKAQKAKAPTGRGGPKKAPAPPKGKGKGRAPPKNARGSNRRAAPTTRSESLLRPNSSFRLGRSGEDEIGQHILESLLINDPINDRLDNPIYDVDPEPEISGGQQIKKTQFDVLFGNIPPGGNKSTIRDDRKKLQEASKSFGYAKVRAVNGKWLVKGMRSPLYHHQLLGAQWMVGRELSQEPPHGGLLADSMGLGKTVQTLACMVGNPPTADDLSRNVKATLIVVPAAVLDQWMDEIRFHAETRVFRKIQRYKSSSQLSREVLEDMDIVVTTYNEVMKQFPYPNKQEREEIQRIGYQRWWKQALEHVGDLHKVNWYRIVLDEAHAIKNNSARTSLACQNLSGIYRWCLTGTPLLNRLEELFPYLRFLKAHYSMDWQTFQKYFCDPNSPDSQNRIATLLSYTMMRRTMKTTILNRPIITLPKPHPKVLYIDFSPEEKIIYRITENRFRRNINNYFQQGEVRRNYSVFMVQLLRLRQCTSHPFMLERTIKEAWTLEDLNELKDKLGKLGARGSKPFYEQTRIWVLASEAARAAARERGEEPGPLLPFGRGDYGDRFDMGKAINSLSETELHQRVNCGFCGDMPTETMETDCGHLFCKECLENYLHDLAAMDDEFMTCPVCNQIFTRTTARELADDEEDPLAPASGSKRKSKNPAIAGDSKGRDALGFEPGAESLWLYRSDNDPEFPLTPSAKTATLKAELLNGFEEAPLDKSTFNSASSPAS